MGRMISDGVWRRLDPYPGALAPGTVRRLRVAVAVAVLAAVALGAAWHTGVVVPRFTASANEIRTSDTGFEIPVTITNRNAWAEVSIDSVGRSGPGLELTRVANPPPRSLAPGESVTVTLVFRVTDCAVVPVAPWPVPVRVARSWGIQTVHVDLPTWPSDDPSDTDPEPVQWQRYFADRACT